MRYVIGGLAIVVSYLSVILLGVLASVGAVHFERASLATVVVLVAVVVACGNLAISVWTTLRWMSSKGSRRDKPCSAK